MIIKKKTERLGELKRVIQTWVGRRVFGKSIADWVNEKSKWLGEFVWYISEIELNVTVRWVMDESVEERGDCGERVNESEGWTDLPTDSPTDWFESLTEKERIYVWEGVNEWVS